MVTTGKSDSEIRFISNSAVKRNICETEIERHDGETNFDSKDFLCSSSTAVYSKDFNYRIGNLSWDKGKKQLFLKSIAEYKTVSPLKRVQEQNEGERFLKKQRRRRVKKSYNADICSGATCQEFSP